MRRMLCVLICWSGLFGCGNDPVEPDRGTQGEEEVVDYCEEFGWYGDGHCDEICPRPDPDCATYSPGSPGSPVNNTNPDPVPPPADPVCEDVPWPREYVADPSGCELIDYGCPDGWVHFADDCGCGCEQLDDPDPGPICDELHAQGTVEFVSEDPAECATIFIACDEDQIPFDDDECGCGCITPYVVGHACLDDSKPDVDRVGVGDECALIDFVCAEGWTMFQDDCGCGCRLNCSDDFECPDGYCIRGTEDDPTCVYPNCDDGTELACRALKPDCYDSDVAAVINGCWECLDARTCGPSNGP